MISGNNYCMYELVYGHVLFLCDYLGPFASSNKIMREVQGGSKQSNKNHILDVACN